MNVEILRLGHRGERDKRISTHVALTARALGASKIIFSTEDSHVRESVNRIVESWGGNFKFEVVSSWRSYIKKFKDNNGLVVHLTMYGENVNEAMDKIKNEMKQEKHRLIVIIGAEKVPREAYDLADYNVSIGNQPHSEVAALAIFLDRLFEGKTLYKEYEDAKIKVNPSEKEKSVVIQKD
ncbi:MAG: tRNA (cytidine56-2-O)-methyltransferase [Methanothermococcus sp.]|jgi:tRNA (cytidine56-2'-O)-methyltransferase|uniref:tRNA (cytidine(56)-2'-O)-methyltransferase n=1 Tax=Methanothermococcus TaxID=155862 RepID=UPI0003713FE8|nr:MULTISPECIES: tRNA (cytidine(56)-2'-O)-methyltransferase [Methanothermococcus]MDK2789763.1 tRNA (cytidine56-2-O)-methyltransferase [Methanothermococcus sp.]MDK2986978.1 tRNA (cytidine56-2-O)-methyltransferase [Methanothermococcus sp.]